VGIMRCKFDRTIKCVETACIGDKCATFRNFGQQTFPPQPQIIETKKRKGHTTTYYKVKKEK
jgi:hypothetical protein